MLWRISPAVADDTAVHERLRAIRRTNKQALARLVADRLGIQLDPDALFDVHIKRIHEYKRQLLNILETIALYNEMRARPMYNWVPRVKIFAGKAAASYRRAKLIIKLINDVARRDQQRSRVAWAAEGGVHPGLQCQPGGDDHSGLRPVGADLHRGHGGIRHRQHEAGVERRADHRHAGWRERGDPRACRRRQHLHIRPDRGRSCRAPAHRGPGARETIARLPMLREVLDAISYGVFSPDEPQRFQELVDELYGNDHFLVTADFAAYAATQARVAARWHDPRAWWRSSVLNTAHVGWFSSDRAIREYAAGHLERGAARP